MLGITDITKMYPVSVGEGGLPFALQIVGNEEDNSEVQDSESIYY